MSVYSIVAYVDLSILIPSMKVLVLCVKDLGGKLKPMHLLSFLSPELLSRLRRD
jgi:hypothetical protein